MNNWDDYYTKNKPEDIPWTGASEIFLGKIWKKFNLSLKGNILDIGCARGDKSIFLASKGYKIWGIDISEVAVNISKEASKNLKNKPEFITADISKLNEVDEIKGVKSDAILDLSLSQFLKSDEKEKYLEKLSKYLKHDQTFYILLTFAKDDESDKQEEIADWVKQIAQSHKEVESIYGKYFKSLDKSRSYSNKGKSDTYILKAK